MKTKILKGKPVSEKILKDVKEKIKDIKEPIKIAIMRVGENSADLSYQRGVISKAEKIGIDYVVEEFDEDVEEEKYIEKLKDLNEDDTIHGILLLKPLPESFDEEKIDRILDPKKDLDCVNPENMGNVFLGRSDVFPCTAKAIIDLLDYYDIDIESKRITIINRTYRIGKPLMIMLIDRDGTVTLSHSRTKPEDMQDIICASDILITGMGKANYFDDSYFCKPSVIIDVGMSLDENEKLTGDVDEEEVEGVVRAITPVIGGVGTITSSILFQNLVANNKQWFD